ncbi:MAG: DUF1109 family protein, partial [Proteobacteria bacterium]|nr:DUF1109 family protein [Pseudomonadota bacterium]
MKTTELIEALTTDLPASSSPRRSRMVVLAAWALGVLACGTAFWLTLGPREDMATIAKTWRFDFKVLWAILLVATSLRASLALMRPTASAGTLWRGILAPLAVLALGVGAELVISPSSIWLQRAIGSNSSICLKAIPSLSLLPLVIILPALRIGAPASPVAAGASAGLLSASVAA